ncbi:MAG: hypothetical protein K2V38_18910, partial [Gemmataceae bacterium]|nr:hypothetical protein [Gemmataceae bacterium]
ANRPNLLDKLKARWGGKKAHACGPVCDPCAATALSSPCATPAGEAHPPVTTPPTTGGTTPPKEMPKPKDPKDVKEPAKDPKDAKDPKTGNTSGVPLPLPPVAGPVGPRSPY